MVGARNASALGRKLAGTLARDLGEAGLGVVSGLARGIDTSAHEGSLAGGTCAVIAGGIDVIYPPENASLYERVADARGHHLRNAAGQNGSGAPRISRAATG